LQSPDFSDLDFRVYPAHAGRSSFVMDISKGRFARRVTVNPKTAQHLQPEHFDSNLAREVRIAMLTVPSGRRIANNLAACPLLRKVIECTAPEGKNFGPRCLGTCTDLNCPKCDSVEFFDSLKLRHIRTLT